MHIYRIDLDEIECMTFLMKVKEFLQKYNKIWEKVSNIIKTTKTSTQKNALIVFIYISDTD